MTVAVVLSSLTAATASADDAAPEQAGAPKTLCLPHDFADAVGSAPADQPEDIPLSDYGSDDPASNAEPPPGAPEAPAVTIDYCAFDSADAPAKGSTTLALGIAGTRNRSAGWIRYRFVWIGEGKWGLCLYTRDEPGFTKIGCAHGQTPGGKTISVKANLSPALNARNKFRLVFYVPGSGVSYRNDRQFAPPAPPARIQTDASRHAVHSAAAGYPDGTGEFEYNHPFFQWLFNSGWRKEFALCVGPMRESFIRSYRTEQDNIRRNFKGDYNLGSPAQRAQPTREGWKGLYSRQYQIFDGGSWGRSSLTTAHASFLLRNCLAAPHLITGTIYRKWTAIGHVNTLGGPLGGQYRAGPYVDQNFEKGQIGFSSATPGDVWWHRWGEPWHR